MALSWCQGLEARSLPVVHVAIVRDGPSELVPELRDLLRREITELTSHEFDVRFPEDLQLEGGWSVKGINQAIDRVLAQPRADLVIALGILASNEIGRRKQLSKPVIAPFVLDPELQGLPFKRGKRREEPDLPRFLEGLRAQSRGLQRGVSLYSVDPLGGSGLTERLSVIERPCANDRREVRCGSYIGAGREHCRGDRWFDPCRHRGRLFLASAASAYQ